MFLLRENQLPLIKKYYNLVNAIRIEEFLTWIKPCHRLETKPTSKLKEKHMTTNNPERNDPTMFIILAVIIIVAIVLAIVFFSSNPANPAATATLDTGIGVTTDVGVTDVNDEMTEVQQTMPAGGSTE